MIIILVSKKQQTKEQLEQIFSSNGVIKALQKAKAEGMVRSLGITGQFEPIILLEAIKRYPFDLILLAVNAADVHYLSFKKLPFTGIPKTRYCHYRYEGCHTRAHDFKLDTTTTCFRATCQDGNKQARFYYVLLG